MLFGAMLGHFGMLFGIMLGTFLEISLAYPGVYVRAGSLCIVVLSRCISVPFSMYS